MKICMSFMLFTLKLIRECLDFCLSYHIQSLKLNRKFNLKTQIEKYYHRIVMPALLKEFIRYNF